MLFFRIYQNSQYQHLIQHISAISEPRQLGSNKLMWIGDIWLFNSSHTRLQPFQKNLLKPKEFKTSNNWILRMACITSRKLEIEGALSAIFVIKTPRYDCCFVSLSIFPWTWSNFNLETKKRFLIDFNDFLWQAKFWIICK